MQRPKHLAVPAMMIFACALIASMGAINLELIAPTTVPALVRDNTSVDNGPAIVEWMRKGKRLPAGMYFVSSTMVIGSHSPGWSLRGNGMPDQVRNNGNWDTGDDRPVTILIWNGAPGGTVLDVRSGAFVMEDIGIEGISVPGGSGLGTDELGVEHMTCDLVKFYQVNGGDWPVGNIQISRCMFGVANRVFYAPGVNHCDHITVSDCFMHWIKKMVVVEERQSVEWIFRAITIDPGGGTKGEAVFDFVQGGRMKAEVTPLGRWEALILCPIVGAMQAAYNYGHYDIFIFIDNTTYFDETIVERCDDEDAACVVNVHGYSSKDVTFPDPTILNEDSEFTINVQRVGGAGEDFEYPDPE